MSRKIGSYIFIAMFLFFPSMVFGGGEAQPCSKRECVQTACGEKECGLDNNGNIGCCCTQYTCDGENEKANCGPGYYWSNNGCVPIGTGSGAVKPRPECSSWQANCPAGTRPDFSQPVGAAFCLTSSSCNVMGGKVGDAQSVVGCCWSKVQCVEEVCDNKGCWCDKHDEVCMRRKIQNYKCVPLAPPVTITYTLSTTGNSLGCTPTNGYVGMQSNNVMRVNVTTPTSYSGGNPSDIRVWFGANRPSVEDFSNSVSQVLVNNNNFGIVVRKTSGQWNNIYGASRYNTSNNSSGASIQSWAKIGTVSDGATLNGRNGKPMARIDNISVGTTGANTVLTFDIVFYNNTSNLPAGSYEVASTRVYDMFGAARYSNTTGGTTWVDSTRDITIDLTPPSMDSMSASFAGGTNINLTWAFSDVDPNGGGNGLIRTVGNAEREREGRVESTIDDLTSNVTEYVLGSGSSGNIYTNATRLWRVNSNTGRTENIDLKQNEGGSIEFFAHSFDKACNYTRGSMTLPLGDPWIATKAGLFYTKGGTSFDLISLYTGGSLTERLSNDSYWNLPYAVYKSDADLTTESIISTSPTLDNLLYSARLASTRALNTGDDNNKEGYWFDRLKSKLNREKVETPDNYSVLVNEGDFTASGKSTDMSINGVACESAKSCVIEVSGNLSVQEGFICDARTLFVVSGSTTLNPDITASAVNNGCMFLSKGDVTITAGNYKSQTATYAKFDLLNAYIITDGRVVFSEGDTGLPHRDGLKITGGVLAFGKENGRSMVLDRSLTLIDANSFPAVVVHFDNRYLNFATIFFGGNTDGYKSEVGFKPL